MAPIYIPDWIDPRNLPNPFKRSTTQPTPTTPTSTSGGQPAPTTTGRPTSPKTLKPTSPNKPKSPKKPTSKTPPKPTTKTPATTTTTTKKPKPIPKPNLTPSQQSQVKFKNAAISASVPISNWTPEATKKLGNTIYTLLEAHQKTTEPTRGQKRLAESVGLEDKIEKIKRRKARIERAAGRGAGGNLGGNRVRDPNLVVRIDLEAQKPEPIQQEYLPHSPGDITNARYTELFRRLHVSILSFATKYFVLPTSSPTNNPNQNPISPNLTHVSPWIATEFGEEFLYWVNLVAEPDNNLGGWDRLIEDDRQRKWLVVAVLVRVLRVKVFETDLFGAGEEEKKLLLGIERAFLGSEGYTRTALRSETVRTILAHSPVTSEFYPSVAHLTAQITQLFSPLANYLYSLPSLIPPNILNFHQELHNIVSSAAYLSLCIRLSPSIIYFVDPIPGSPYEEEMWVNLEDSLWLDSKTQVQNTFQLAQTRFAVRNQELIEACDAFPETERIKGSESSAYLAAWAEYQAHQSTSPIHPSNTYRALTKIAIWPEVRRYKAGGKEDDELDEQGRCVVKGLLEKEGQRDEELWKGSVVTYYGPEGRTRKQSLWRYTKEKKEEMREKRVVGYLAGALGLALVGAAVTNNWKEAMEGIAALSGSGVGF